MDHNGQQQSNGVYHNMTLTSIDFLASIIAPGPPFSVVFTDWLSMMAALGVGSRPWASLTLGRSASWILSQVPSSRHCLKYHHTVPHGGKSWGSIRQGMPPRRTYKIPLITSRNSTVGGCPPGFGSGSNGASSFHWASVRSLGYGLRVIPQGYHILPTSHTPS
jgi:hypothetical protein